MAGNTATSAAPATIAALADRVKGALFGLLIADALSMPTHWYYGGKYQVQRDYGTIAGFVAPKTRLPGSIMGKSNTGGAGRGGDSGSIIGDVIFHGKKSFWKSGSGYHYHQGMAAGENTLEALLVRRVAAVVADQSGRFDVDALTEDYIKFMTTPGTHNDTYAGTCHRMYFANWIKKVPPARCPGNDGHNVDTTDSLVTTVPIALRSESDEQAAEEVAKMVAITRQSRPSQQYASLFSQMLRDVARGSMGARAAVQQVSLALGYDATSAVQRSRGQDPVTA